jgi:HEAT repeat protein
MIKFLRSIQIERLSFWFGFLAATVFWFVFTRIRPRLEKYRQRLNTRVRSTSQNIRANIGQRHRRDTLKLAQGNHLAASLFSLDEILIPPRLAAPPVIFQPEGVPPNDDIIELTIPYMPDCPELASAFNGHTLSLEEALSGGVNLALVGPPGSGKTTALGYLASQLARQKIELTAPEEAIPILVHASNLIQLGEEDKLLAAIIKAVAVYSSPLSATRIPNFIQNTFANGQAFLLIDGLDELPPDELTAVNNYIQEILSEYPATRIVVAADANHIGNLPNMGFASIPMAIWGTRQQAQFAKQWGNVWSEYIESNQDEEPDSISPLLLNGWLLNRHSALTPFEFTLQMWATYAGDVRGPSLADAIEAYVRRTSAHIPNAIEAMERFAGQVVLAQKSVIAYDEAQAWAKGLVPEDINDELDNGESVEEEAIEEEVAAEETADAEEAEEILISDQPAELTISRILPELSKNGVMVARIDDQMAFSHPIILGYLAGRYLDEANFEALFSLPDWEYKSLSVQFVASHQEITPYANQLFALSDDPLYRGPISIGRWLKSIPLEATWRKIILGRLSNLISDENIALGARARILCGLAKTKDPDIGTLFRHLLKSQKISVRQLGALGSGYQRDPQAVDILISLLGDQPAVSRAAAMALVNIGTQPALEALATALLQGTEDIRRAAAESFASHPQEGHPTLREAIMLDDLLVRRAAIYGLRKINEPWAIKILEEMQIEDAQWVVKNAAAQVVEEFHQPDAHIPQLLPAINETPWLIAFAEERGVGLSPGEPAWKALLLALKEGSEEQQLAAMSLFQYYSYPNIFPVIFDPLMGEDDEMKEIAYATIWQIASTGAEIPSPMVYGLG